MKDCLKDTDYTVLSYRKNNFHCDFVLGDRFLKKTVDSPNYHFHSAYEIHICMEGCMHITVEEEHYDLLPHDLCIIAPGRVHYVQMESDAVGMGFRFCFSSSGREKGEDAALFASAFSNTRDEFVVRNCDVLEKYVIHASENMKNGGSSFITSSLLFLTLYDLVDRIIQKEDPVDGTDCDSSDIALSERIENYINSNYNRKMTLFDLAEHINFCTRQTERMIKKLFGMTYGELLSQKRLAVARLLLRTTDRSLDEIAAACGFEDKSYFCRRFVATFGLTPGKYREKNSGEPN